jgi:hypothetical protein
MEEMAMLACPDCHTMKMGDMALMSKMMESGACGGPMKEMKMM